MATTLAFDTSQQTLSIAIAQNGTILSHHSTPMATGQSEALAPAVQQILQEANLTFSDLNRIVAITGPGSFTGLRISLATAQGLGLALSIPVVGLDSFTAYATCIHEECNILVVIDSQKQDVYCQLFSPHHQKLKDPMALDPIHISEYAGSESFILTGTGLEKILPYMKDKNLSFEVTPIKPDQICQNSCFIDEVHFTVAEPYYLKEPMVTKPR